MAFAKNGRDGRIRTYDPLLPKQMRYQAALRPEEQNYSRLLTITSKTTTLRVLHALKKVRHDPQFGQTYRQVAVPKPVYCL